MAFCERLDEVLRAEIRRFLASKSGRAARRASLMCKLDAKKEALQHVKKSFLIVFPFESISGNLQGR